MQMVKRDIKFAEIIIEKIAYPFGIHRNYDGIEFCTVNILQKQK